MKTSRTFERLVPPHPSPLPQGEEATQPGFRALGVAGTQQDCRRFSLFLRERAGVRGKDAHEVPEAKNLKSV
jgi:hypothetical protein